MTTLKFTASAIAAVLLLGCENPGEGRRFESAIMEAEPVLAAIQKHHATTGKYPDSLSKISPELLNRNLLRKHSTGKSISFYYELKSEKEFIFEFTYNGPGRNRCSYIPKTNPPKWDCWGSY